MLPNGRIGTAKATASPSLGVAHVQAAARTASAIGQYAGKKASVEDVQPANSAAAAAAATRVATGGRVGSATVRGSAMLRGSAGSPRRGRVRDGRGRVLRARRSPEASFAAAGRFAGSIESDESTSR